MQFLSCQDWGTSRSQYGHIYVIVGTRMNRTERNWDVSKGILLLIMNYFTIVDVPSTVEILISAMKRGVVGNLRVIPQIVDFVFVSLTRLHLAFKSRPTNHLIRLGRTWDFCILVVVH